MAITCFPPIDLVPSQPSMELQFLNEEVRKAILAMEEPAEKELEGVLEEYIDQYEAGCRERAQTVLAKLKKSLPEIVDDIETGYAEENLDKRIYRSLKDAASRQKGNRRLKILLRELEEKRKQEDLRY